MTAAIAATSKLTKFDKNKKSIPPIGDAVERADFVAKCKSTVARQCTVVTDLSQRPKNMRTRIVNDSGFPTSFLRAACNFCLPEGVTGIDVVFLEPLKRAKTSSGSCWVKGVKRNKFQRPFIYVAIFKTGRFPSPPNSLALAGGYLPEPYFASREEEAVFYLAHELRHVWQWKARVAFSEYDADAYGIHILRRWRRFLGGDTSARTSSPCTLDPLALWRRKLRSETKRRLRCSAAQKRRAMSQSPTKPDSKSFGSLTKH